ncbi:hypothetical protein E3T53_14260 [Cryobacterium psychrophilum]|uniref:Uncharacterized protein n=1 Tax=Cryobacterium psychrophilum TaxID=41988 RepID=A0A4Y8KMN8_9MICO|nr:hypothetical protein E3T53_14260 [Cryobacterium psychrophilum]
MCSREPELRDWSRRLTHALLILDLQVDRNLLLDLAAATGEKNAKAVESAVPVARQICATSTSPTGWVDTAQ